MNHIISTKHDHKMHFTAEIDGHKVVMDKSLSDGGDNAGPSPKKLMLAALTGCTAVDIVSILNRFLQYR